VPANHSRLDTLYASHQSKKVCSFHSKIIFYGRLQILTIILDANNKLSKDIALLTEKYINSMVNICYHSVVGSLVNIMII